MEMIKTLLYIDT